MPTSLPVRLLPAALLLAAAAGCDRTPRGQAPAPAASAARVEAGATTTAMPASPGTVALSGAVRDLPPSTTPDSQAARPRVAPATPSAAVRPPPIVDTRPRTAPPRETEAMREFREAQARRDRELLERDMDESRSSAGPESVARGGASRGTADRDDPRYDPRSDDVIPPEIDAPVDEELPVDEVPPLDEDLPLEEDLPMDEDLPPEDDELQWDPATGTWR